MTFLETLSNLFDVPMREGKIRQYADLLDREGRVTKRVQLDVLLALCEKVAEIEREIGQPIHASVATTTSLDAVTNDPLTREAELKLKRQENIKKAQEARRKKYELKRAANKQNS